MDNPLLYLDLEGPGVPDDATPDQIARQHIFEIGVILVSADLSHEYGRYETVLRPTPGSLDELRTNAFVLDMHTRSGLYAELTSNEASLLPELSEAEDRILALLEKLPEGQKVTIAGSGVARYDRLQVVQQMPRLAARLTYDEQDISSMRKRFEYITGHTVVPPKPAKAHRALADIEDDIRHQKAFDRVFAGLGETDTTDPVGRQLLALALTEQYMNHDSFLNADGAEIATVQPPKAIRALLEGVPAIEVVAGYMSVTQQLLRLLAETNGMQPVTALAGIRGAVLNAGASHA